MQHVTREGVAQEPALHARVVVIARADADRVCLRVRFEVAQAFALPHRILREHDQSRPCEGLADVLVFRHHFRRVVMPAQEQHRGRPARRPVQRQIEIRRHVVPRPRLEDDLLDPKAVALDRARHARVQRRIGGRQSSEAGDDDAANVLLPLPDRVHGPDPIALRVARGEQPARALVDMILELAARIRVAKRVAIEIPKGRGVLREGGHNEQEREHRGHAAQALILVVRVRVHSRLTLLVAG